MKTIFIKNPDTFNQIKNGTKTIEIRKKTPFIDDLHLNNLICFKYRQEICIAKIIKINRYSSLNTLIGDVIKHSLLKRVNSNITNKNNAISHYTAYYGLDDLNNSFISIEFKKA